LNTQPQPKPLFTPLDILLKQVDEKMMKIKHKIMVLSGKGGVGKSFVSSMLSLALADLGYKVALLDADIHGSSIPTLLGIEGLKIYADQDGIQPAEGPLGVRVVAMNLMLPTPETPIIWRGPLKAKAIIELLAKVSWGECDYLIIDLPPGTGDEALTVVQSIRNVDGALIVTMPGVLSEVIVAKAINFVLQNNVKLLGIVENMSYFRCPESGREYYLLGKSVGERLAEKYGTIMLAQIPFDPYIGEAIDSNKPYYIAYREGEAAKALRSLALKLIELTGDKNQ